MQNKNLDQFLSKFFPDPDEQIHVQALPPKGGPGFACNFVITRNSLDHREDELRTANEKLNLFFRPNSGGGEDKDITRFNALFIEKDNASFTTQHKALHPYRPHIVLETLRSVHAYWLLATPNELTPPAWSHLQNELIARFKSDTTIKNPSRAMRLAYFDYIVFSPIHGGIYTRMPVVNVAYDDHFGRISGAMDYEKIFGAELKTIKKANDKMLSGIKEGFDPNAEVTKERNMALFRFVRHLCCKVSDPEVIRQAARTYYEVKITDKEDFDEMERDRTIEQAIGYGISTF